ncbi:hypothetical protein KKC94_04615 [Patescibacteria group bacterium]|nr:hypothetical protein [Patescibacteria group bacterium]
MITKFDLHIGEMKTYERHGKYYKISCDLFKDHDHKNKPIYYYHEGQKADDIVATVEANDNPPYDSPYSSEVHGNWIVFRANVVIHFIKKKNGLRVEIEDI